MKKKIMYVFLGLTLLTACSEKSEDLKNENRVVINKEQIFVHYNNEIIELTQDMYLTNEKQVSDYLPKGILKKLNLGGIKKSEFLNDLNKYFPQGIKGVTKNEEGSLKSIKIPTVKVGGKTIIDSIKLVDVLAKGDKESLIKIEDDSEIVETKEIKIDLKGKKIAIMNANGINGFARELGKELESKLEITFTAENYSKPETKTYIVNHKLTEEELNAFVKSLPMKYIEIMKNDDLKSDSDLVLITGEDSKVNFKVSIISKVEESALKNILSSYKVDYKTDKMYNNENIKDEIVIFYNPVDKLIANRIKGNLVDAKLVEDSNLKNEIVITTNK